LPPFEEVYASINGSKKMGLIMACTVQVKFLRILTITCQSSFTFVSAAEATVVFYMGLSILLQRFTYIMAAKRWA
jgi:hypothetical protein